jgi:hypothetical protein
MAYCPLTHQLTRKRLNSLTFCATCSAHTVNHRSRLGRQRQPSPNRLGHHKVPRASTANARTEARLANALSPRTRLRRTPTLRMLTSAKTTLTSGTHSTHGSSRRSDSSSIATSECGECCVPNLLSCMHSSETHLGESREHATAHVCSQSRCLPGEQCDRAAASIGRLRAGHSGTMRRTSDQRRFRLVSTSSNSKSRLSSCLLGVTDRASPFTDHTSSRSPHDPPWASRSIRALLESKFPP